MFIYIYIYIYMLLFAFCQALHYGLKVNYWYSVYIWYIWYVCFCQNRFSAVYVHNFNFVQLDQREVKKKSSSKVNKIKKKISNGKSSKGKSLNKIEVIPMVDNEVTKTPLEKQKEKVYGLATHQSLRKRVKQMTVAQMSQLMKKKISQTIPVMMIWKALTKERLN